MNKLPYVAKRSAMTAILLLAAAAASAQASGATPPSSSSGKQAPPGRQARAAGAKDQTVTAVTGESWLNHLHRQLSDTSMGRTGRSGPPPPAPGEAPPRGQPGLPVSCFSQAATLHGADLYRLNCQGCHGEAGQGAPPEINSVLDPVRGTFAPLVLERMKKRGVDMSPAEATQLAQQAQVALLDRIHNGGKSMPAFPQLNDVEIRSVVAYLRQLAGIPGAEHQQVAVNEPPLRVGELIVKSTCHTCHSATGPNPSPQQMLDGAIPPLETLTTRKEQSGLIQKVTQGAPVTMGTPPTLTRGRMPVFYYLSSEEAADVYLYLTQYPPSELSVLDNAALVQVSAAPEHKGTTPSTATARSYTGAQPTQPGGRAEMSYAGLFAGFGLLATVLLTGGLGFTLWEFRRLSPKKARLVLVVPPNPRMDLSTAQSAFATRQGPCRTAYGRNPARRLEPTPMGEVEDLARQQNKKGERQCSGTRLG